MGFLYSLYDNTLAWVLIFYGIYCGVDVLVFREAHTVSSGIFMEIGSLFIANFFYEIRKVPKHSWGLTYWHDEDRQVQTTDKHFNTYWFAFAGMWIGFMYGYYCIFFLDTTSITSHTLPCVTLIFQGFVLMQMQGRLFVAHLLSDENKNDTFPPDNGVEKVIDKVKDYFKKQSNRIRGLEDDQSDDSVQKKNFKD